MIYKVKKVKLSLYLAMYHAMVMYSVLN